MMSPILVFRWFLYALVSQSIANEMHSCKMSIMKGRLFQCANTTCPPFVSVAASNVRTCQIACLKKAFFQAASFQRSNSSCELFSFIPNQNESISTNYAEFVAMIVISGTRAPSGKWIMFTDDLKSINLASVRYAHLFRAQRSRFYRQSYSIHKFKLEGDWRRTRKADRIQFIFNQRAAESCFSRLQFLSLRKIMRCGCALTALF